MKKTMLHGCLCPNQNLHLSWTGQRGGQKVDAINTPRTSHIIGVHGQVYDKHLSENKDKVSYP